MEATDAAVISASLDDPARFGAIFDRHATTLHRYLTRRVGPDEADGLLGELFRIAFERRASFDRSRDDARPWLYGVATNLIARHRRGEARRLRATARLLARRTTTADVGESVADLVDTAALWPQVADAIAALPDGERDALILYVWEGLSYEQVAASLDLPVGTVRSRLNRARKRLRELHGVSGEEKVSAPLRPDRVLPVGSADPGVFSREKERLMTDIDKAAAAWHQVNQVRGMYPRLAYLDEVAALEYLTNVLGLHEIREARLGTGVGDDGMLAWLEFGGGRLMIGRANDAGHRVHQIFSPKEVGKATAMINVDVVDIDSYYERVVANGANITMPLEDAFYGARRFEVSDPEGHRWHFSEPHSSIRGRGGTLPDDD